ncbi:MAG: radical SAM-associated putative lipoprotein [Paramuribaculum sp.]|nr:radical SAM-associated putative lipoprotein [Paramuribaculum sp.]
MEKANKFRRIFIALLGSVITMLGFNSCLESGDDDDDMLLMYGSPTSKFELKGKVTDQDGAPVKGALITIKQKHEMGDLKNQYQEVWSVDPTASGDDRRVHTNSSGTYYLGAGPVMKTIRVICTPENTDLAADSTEITVTYVKENSKDPWSIGAYSGTVDFKLKRK